MPPAATGGDWQVFSLAANGLPRARWCSRPEASRCRTPAATEPDSGSLRRWATRCTRPIRRSPHSPANAPAHAALSGISLPVTLNATDGGEAAGGHRRVSLHAQGIQRAVGARPVAPGGALAAWRVAARQEITVQWTELDAAAWEERLRAGGTRARGNPGAARAARAPRGHGARAASSVSGSTPTSQLKREERIRLVGGAGEHAAALDRGRGLQEGRGDGRGCGARARSTRARWRAGASPGLFLCGEMLDAFGPIGGYNFMWAWATGRAAGMGSVKRTVNEQRRRNQTAV